MAEPRSSREGSAPGPGDGEVPLGQRIREERGRAGLSLRALARSLNLSASFVSQIENGKSQPSVSTLYAICQQLGISVDRVFPEAAPAGPPEVRRPEPAGARLVEAAGAAPRTAALAAAPLSGGADERTPSSGPVVRAGTGRVIELDSGVTWERLGAASDCAVDFLRVTYEVGGSSSSTGEKLMRHSGVEYGHVLSGTLHVILGFDDYTLAPGDSISFESTTPHLLVNRGDVPVQAIWFVLGRTVPRT